VNLEESFFVPATEDLVEFATKTPRTIGRKTATDKGRDAAKQTHLARCGGRSTQTFINLTAGVHRYRDPLTLRFLHQIL
jgi:hypothetical protein